MSRSLIIGLFLCATAAFAQLQPISGVFHSSPPSLADGQATQVTLDSTGRLIVSCTSGCGGGTGGTSAVDKSTFTVGTTSGTAMMGAVAPVDTVVAGTLAIAALDVARNLKVNCVSGCSGATDATASASIGSLNANVVLTLAGINSASFTLPTGNNLVATLTPQYSSDGGTTWIATNLRGPGSVWAANVVVSSSQNTWNIQVPGGASSVRVIATAYTSGTATVSARGTTQPELVLGTSGTAANPIPPFITQVGGSDGANLRALNTDNAGRPNVNVIAALPTGGNTIGAVTQASGPWTVHGGVASGGANANNPVKTGGVFNTTQPTVTNGQIVDAQYTARGAAIVATGVDAFTVAATQSGTWTVQQGTPPWSVQGNLTNNNASAGANRVAVLQGIVQTDPANGSAYTQGRDVAPNIDTGGTLWVSQLPGLRPASYRGSLNFAASSTTDNACLYGNGTNTIVVYNVQVSGTQTTAGIINVQLIRRSSAEVGGTTNTFDTSADDTNNYAAVTSTPTGYTGTGPTVGTKVGIVYQNYTGFLASGTASPNDVFVWNGNLKPEILIGAGQGLCVNIGNAALSGGNMDVDFSWYQIKNISE